MNSKTVKKSPAKTKAKPRAKTASKSKVDTASPSSHDGVKLIIVESPTKARALTKYLGGGYKVMASGGHIVDLPQKLFGVDIERGFTPDYQVLPGKTKVVNEIKGLAKRTSEIFIATDPDREGEAIAWHISRLLPNRSGNGIKRILYHEVTKSAVLEALGSPGSIDMNKVDAWQARRIMDRIVGYQVSPILWKTVARGLSAGRVQSVALRMICEREAEIAAFTAEEYWTIDGKFKADKIEPFVARLYKLDGEKAKLANEEESKAAVERLRSVSYTVTAVKRSRKKRSPEPPYITSTLQQDAGRRLGYPVKRTMSISQRLYEGVDLGARGTVGLITYMRTDSVRVSETAIIDARDWIASAYGTEYVSDKPRVYKNKKGKVQDAHEAIRPTDLKVTPKEAADFLKPEELKLYELIWRRFVATQMSEAQFDVTAAHIGDGEGVEFRASGQVLVFPGYLAVYGEAKENVGDGEGMLPSGLTTGMPLELLNLDPKQHFTQPPPRYNEASLVKELDELGIGRPSTYASIISTLLDRKYVEKLERALHPTDLGQVVNRLLTNRFPDLFNVKFTAQMEEGLDRIETGDKWQKLLEDFYFPFSKALQDTNDKLPELKRELVLQPVGRECPECGRQLVYRYGRNGRFISCAGFPDCKHTENISSNKPVETSEKCPECGSPMVPREGKFGRFLGCSTYPKCRGILPITTGHVCPREGCEGAITARRTKKGRTFYGCTKFPKCDVTSWNPPVAGPCPECGAPTVFQKTTKSEEPLKYCVRCEWKE